MTTYASSLYKVVALECSSWRRVLILSEECSDRDISESQCSDNRIVWMWWSLSWI